MPRLEVSPDSPTEFKTGLLVLPVFEGTKGPRPGPGVAEIRRALKTDLLGLYQAEGFKGRPGEALAIPSLGRIPAETVLLAGLGPERDAGVDAVRRAALVAGARSRGFASAASTLPRIETAGEDTARAFAEGMILGAYRFDEFKSRPDTRPAPSEIVALLPGGAAGRTRASEAMARGAVHADAANFARDLVNTPADVATPQHMATVARDVARKRGLSFKRWSRHDLEDGGFGGILAVGRGGGREPCMVELEYHGAGNARPYAITGKGITFDAGGLFLKSAKDMEWMKADMAGAAAALAAMRALPQLGLRINVVAALAFAENMPGGDAIRPGDVIRHRGGITSEMTDTDAEGRVLLADVLAFLAERRPQTMIDSATLTETGLGEDLWAVAGSDQRLVNDLRAAGERAGEPGWQLPLWPGYKRHNESEVADVRNANWNGPDTLSACVFLEAFTAGVPWAHLDVGDTAYLETPREGWPTGPTGVPARIILHYLEVQSGSRSR